MPGDTGIGCAWCRELLSETEIDPKTRMHVCAKPQPVRRCDTCQWWDGTLTMGIGWCRVSPPVYATNDDDGSEGSVWPVTHQDDWCAHHAPKPDSTDSP